MRTDLLLDTKLILLISLSLLVSGCDQENTKSFFASRTTANTSAPILNVNVMQVSEVQEAVEISIFFGTLKPNRQSRLRFGRPGRIEKLSKEVGQTVQAGEQIASLELKQLEQQRSELETAIQEAEQTNPSALQQLQSQLQAVERDLASGTIVAPYDCIVAEQSVVAGDSVSPQSPALTVIEAEPVLVEANLPLDIAQSLETGTNVWIVIGADSVEAKVKTRSPIESSAGSRIVSFEVTQSIKSTSWSFGQTVKIRFLTSTTNSGYWIPVSALSRESTGLWSVLVATETNATDVTAEKEDSARPTSQVRRTMLELIQLEDDWALTQGALTDGEFVIVNGAHRVVPGQSVNLQDVTTQYVKPSNGAGE